MTIDHDAIRIGGERTRPETTGWNSVTSAHEFSSSFAVRLEGESVLSNPKRAFDDAGATFWCELRTHLTSTRYLIPGPPRSTSSITNTRPHTGGF